MLYDAHMTDSFVRGAHFYKLKIETSALKKYLCRHTRTCVFSDFTSVKMDNLLPTLHRTVYGSTAKQIAVDLVQL